VARTVRLTARLLAFNLLLVFLPVAGLLFLGPYERQLLDSQERSMVQQGRLLSAALGAGLGGGTGPLTAERVRVVLGELGRRTESRLRVVDLDGRLLGDSSLLGPRRLAADARSERSEALARARGNPLYALGAWPFNLWNRWRAPSLGEVAADEYYATAERLDGPEIRAALAGRYGAATRIAPGSERAVILYSAIPVRAGEAVAGAVVVSQSTVRILEELYEVRLTIFLVFLASIAAAALLSVYFAGTIARPLRALSGEARALIDGRGRLRGRFGGSTRGDEIGELARSLEELTRRLEARQASTEAFAADLSHEFKNPLASIRGASEMLAQAGSPAERERFAGVVEQEVARMERLLSGVREIVRLDAPEELEERRRIDLGDLVAQLVEAVRLRDPHAPAIVVRRPDQPLIVEGAPERFAAMIENLLDNAVGFSPAGGEVEVTLTRGDGEVRIEVADRGPGIPEEHLERLFDRFFSWRPDGAGEEHAGLGLAIVRAVAEAHGGRVAARNRPQQGARFVVSLPAA